VLFLIKMVINFKEPLQMIKDKVKIVIINGKTELKYYVVLMTIYQ
jgi:hypothetical protein